MSSKAKGLYLPNGNFVHFGERPQVGKQIATRASAAGMSNMGDVLPNPDPVLRKLGKSIQVYRDLRADGHVGGCIRRRKAAVKSLIWGVDREQAQSRIAKSIQAIFDDLDMERIIGEILDAPLYGYQPLEVVWDHVGGLLVPVDVIGKPAEWFFFDAENRLRFRSKDAGPAGELVPERAFLLPRQDASYDNPYGQPDLARCFWPTKFKQGGLDFWFRFVEKYGTPWLIGKSPRSTNDAENERLLDMLEQMIQDAVAVIPDDASVEIVEAAGKSSSADVFEKFLMHLRSEVSIALLGQNQTTEASTNKASAQAGLEVASDIRDADAGIVCAALNQLIGWTCDLNFHGAQPVFDMWEEESVDETLATRDEILKRAGATFTNRYFIRTYGLQPGDLSEPPAGDAEHEAVPAAFAEAAAPASVPAVMADRLADDLQPALDSWIDQIRDLAERATSLDELRDGLLALAPDMSLDQYAAAMGQALVAAAAAGRADIVDQVSNG